jgi:hypothetical protein
MAAHEVVLVVGLLGTAVVAGVRGTWSPCGLSMVSAINPFTEASRGHRYALTCAWFVAGAVLGGLGTGAVAAGLALLVGPFGASAPAVVLVVALLATLVCLGSDAGVRALRLPLLPRQVDEAWLDTYRRWIYAAGFGVQIGAGLTTYVMTAATYLLVVLAVLVGSWQWALGACALFGLVRGLAVLLTAGARSPQALRSLHRALEVAGPWSLRVAVAWQAALAVGLGAALAGTPGAVAAGAAATVLVLLPARRTWAQTRRQPSVTEPPAPAASRA